MRGRMVLTQLLQLAAIVGAAYVVICALAFAFQERMVYFPDRRLVADPGFVGLDFEQVTFETADGVDIHGWFIPHPSPRVTVLFLHGNAGNISHRLETIQYLHRLRVDVLIIDYRGYGRSGGRPTEAGTHADAAAAWRYLVDDRGLRPGCIVLFGRSLGGAVAAELARRESPAGLIIESTFTTLPELGAAAYPWLPVRRLSRMRYDVRRAVATTTCPKLIAHSADDEIVPFRMARDLMQVAAPPKRLLTMRGGHNDGFLRTGEAYLRALDGFLAEVCGEASASASADAPGATGEESSGDGPGEAPGERSTDR